MEIFHRDKPSGESLEKKRGHIRSWANFVEIERINYWLLKDYLLAPREGLR